MINFDQFKKFDRVKPLDQYEQQRQYWIFRNDILNPLFSRTGAGAAGASGGGRKKKQPTVIPSAFSFFTTPGQVFTTQLTDFLVKSSTGYVIAYYPYDIPTPIFGTGDPLIDIQVELTDTTPWNGLLPFYLKSCDIDGNLTGDITYVKFDNLSYLKSLDFTDCKDDVIEIDVAGCVDLESFIIPSSISLTTLNISNTIIGEIELNGCEYLETFDFSNSGLGSTFPTYTLDLSDIQTLISVVGDSSINLWGILTSAPTLEQVSLNDCTNLTVITCTNFTGNGGLGRIQVKNGSLGPSSLDNLFSSLNTAGGSINTLYIYGNSGIFACDQTIATNKGYTVDINP
jgi:hypothetical protein